MKSLVKEQYHFELKSTDWDFSGEDGTEGFAAYHWYPARYVPHIPGILINYFSKPAETVLDPFCGSGTTLVEAYKSGRLAVGIDLNPTAILMSKAKLVSFNEVLFSQYKTELLAKAGDIFVQLLGYENHDRILRESVPNYEENVSWYDPLTLLELAALWSAISEYSRSEYFCVGRTAFSSILLSCCSQEKHWGWVCDNVKPKKLTYKSALNHFFNKLCEYELSAKSLQIEASELQDTKISASDINAIEGDCIKVLADYSAESFDLVVTSPPYFSMTDYVKSQRLSNLWFANDTDEIKKEEIGARYKRDRRHSLDEYLEMMEASFTAILRVLKRGHFCCVVLGESPRHKPYIGQFKAICEDMGLEIWDSISRKVSSNRRLIPSIHREEILIMRRK
jgi:DNA modification methylase